MLHNKIILATHNLHKQREMDSILRSIGIPIVGLNEFPQIEDIEETGTTLIENAFIKAHTVYQLTGIPALSDDTGLEVDALDGDPGVFSARYAGQKASYKENCDKLLAELGKYYNKRRYARFRTVMAFVDGQTEHHSEGVIEGVIVKDPRGDSGFGYDSIFQPISGNKTFAEMDKNEKNKISHRSLAMNKMKFFLKNYFN